MCLRLGAAEPVTTTPPKHCSLPPFAGDHTKLDNMVQIGHNARVGRGCMLCAHVALGGSSTIGDFCVLGGKAAVADHVTVADRVRIAACSGVTKHITKPGDYAGMPAQPINRWRREVAALRAAASERDARRRAAARSADGATPASGCALCR